MTLPHQLMRLVLLEQVYRAFRLIVGTVSQVMVNMKVEFLEQIRKQVKP